MKIKVLVAVIVLLVGACGAKEEREAKYLDRGKALFEQGDDIKAQLEFRNALQINSKGVDAQYYLGLIAERQSNWEQAFARFSRVVEENPDHAEAQLKLAQLYLVGNELDKADVQVAILARLRPESAELYALRSNVALRRGRLAEARLLAEGALAKDPAHIAASMIMASVLSAQGDPSGATTALNTSLQRNPKDVSLRLLKIKLGLDNSQFDDAAAGYRELIALQPDEFQYRLGLAQIEGSRDRIDEAEAVLREAAAAGVGGTTAKLAIVDLYAQKKGFSAAEAEAKALLQDAPDEYAYALKLADLYAGNNQTAEAAATLRRVAESDGDGLLGNQARIGLARLSLIEGDRAEAKVLADAVLKADANNVDALLLRGALALDAGDTDRALVDARSVLRGTPRSVPALRLLAQTQLRRNETQLAADTLAQIVDAEPGDLAAREQLASLHSARGNLDQALDLYNAVLAKEPKRLRSMLAKVEVLIAKKRWSAAEAAIGEILALDNNKAAGHLLAGRLYQARGLPDAAVGEFEQAHALTPDAPEPVAGIVQTYFSAKQPEKAIAYLDTLIAAKSDDAFLLNMRGEALANQGQVDDAAEAFRAAIAAKPEWEIPYVNLGGLLVGSGRGSDAIAAFRDGLERLPDNMQLLFALAAAQEQTGDPRGAISTYETILDKHPASEVAANNYAALVADFAFQDQAASDRAFELVKRYQTSDNPYYLDSLGWVLYRRGDYAQARIYLERAANLKGDVPIIHYHLAMALYRLNDKEAARRSLEKAIASDAEFPGKDEARTILARLQES